jgi:hypothetical protein
MLDTPAAAYAESRNFEKAIEWQTKEIESAGCVAGKQDSQDRHELYREESKYPAVSDLCVA